MLIFYVILKKIIFFILVCLDIEDLEVVCLIFFREECNELVVVNY